jgi:L-rhamnose-H+ transport protein
MKFTRHWRWENWRSENTWLVFCVVSLVTLPWGRGVFGQPSVRNLYFDVATSAGSPFSLRSGVGHCPSVVRGLGAATGTRPCICNYCWFGAMLGTLVPLFVQARSRLSVPIMLNVFLGVVTMLIGIALSTWGGRVREESERAISRPGSASGYGAAVLLAVVCGVMAPMLNYSFAFGQSIAHQAVILGNREVHAAYAVWPVGLAGGFLPNIAYSARLLTKERSWARFQHSAEDGFFSILMAVLWMGSFTLYGMSAIYLGSFGTSIGWGLFQIFMMLTAMLSGVVTGEWNGAPTTARMLLVAGFACLIGATALLAMANR